MERTRTEKLREVVKLDGGIVQVAKSMVKSNDACGFTQDELVSLIGEHDRQQGETEIPPTLLSLADEVIE